MGGLSYIALRECPKIKDDAARWFHSKWQVPESSYLECMTDYLEGKTEYGWYLCLDGDRIVGGLAVIENDFHKRKDLTQNICAVYTEDDYRCLGIAGRLLDMAVEDLRTKEISPVYLVTDHVDFYERYGWEYICLVEGDDGSEISRMYIHK
jgi:predicted acetyltransferase